MVRSWELLAKGTAGRTRFLPEDGEPRVVDGDGGKEGVGYCAQSLPFHIAILIQRLDGACGNA